MFSNQNPRIETITAPVKSDNLSIITNGAVLVIGTSNLFFNNCDFTSSPSCPGVADIEKLDMYIRKPCLRGTEIALFFSSIVHLRNNAHQLTLTSVSITGR